MKPCRGASVWQLTVLYATQRHLWPVDGGWIAKGREARARKKFSRGASPVPRPMSIWPVAGDAAAWGWLVPAHGDTCAGRGVRVRSKAF